MRVVPILVLVERYSEQWADLTCAGGMMGVETCSLLRDCNCSCCWLRSLFLSDNQLSGSIPSSIGVLEELMYVHKDLAESLAVHSLPVSPTLACSGLQMHVLCACLCLSRSSATWVGWRLCCRRALCTA